MCPTTSKKHETPSPPLAGHSVPTIVQSIRRDHRIMEELLGILQQELVMFRRGEQPDFEILTGIVEFFQSYPNCALQPKEALVLAAIEEHAPDCALSLHAGTAGGRQAARHLEHFAELVENVINEQETSREDVVAAAKNFAAVVNGWVRFVEGELLPVAFQILTPHVWAALDRKLASKDNPVVDSDMEARFGRLAKRLGKWEREDQAERAWFSQGR